MSEESGRSSMTMPDATRAPADSLADNDAEFSMTMLDITPAPAADAVAHDDALLSMTMPDVALAIVADGDPDGDADLRADAKANTEADADADSWSAAARNVTNNARKAKAKKSETNAFFGVDLMPTQSYEQTFEPDRNRNNEADMEAQINQTNAKSLAATKNMVAMMEEGRDAGYKAQAGLYKQGEQLKATEKDMDRLGSAMDDAERGLDEMEGRAGCCGVKKKKKNGAGGKKGKKMKYKGVGEEDPKSMKNKNKFKYVTGDAQERQMADNLDYVDDILDEMDYMADDMNQEIKAQNKRLDRLQTKADRNKAQQDRVNEKATRVATGKTAQKDEGGGNIVTKAMGM